MSRPFRLLLCLLLALALPFQGSVAAAMMCRVQVPQAAPVAAAAMSHDGQAMPGHCADAESGGETAAHACASCAACGIAGALAPTPGCAIVGNTLHERPLSVRILSPSFVPEGTERPPRPVLA
jgi:hypothetical protein